MHIAFIWDICMKQPHNLLSDKNKNDIINLSSAEFAQESG